MSNVVKEVKQKYELLIPTEIKQSIAVKNYENLKIANHPNVSFYKQNMSTLCCIAEHRLSGKIFL